MSTVKKRNYLPNISIYLNIYLLVVHLFIYAKDRKMVKDMTGAKGWNEKKEKKKETTK